MDASTKYVKAELFRWAVNVRRELKNSARLLHALRFHGFSVYWCASARMHAAHLVFAAAAEVVTESRAERKGNPCL